MLLEALSQLHARTTNERGAVAAEYAVLLALIAVALVVIIGSLTTGITNTFQAIIDVLP